MFRLIPRLKASPYRKKIFTGVGFGLSALVSYASYKGAFQELQKDYTWFMGFVKEIKENRARKAMLATDVAHGLAWSHYSGYLKYVLKDIDQTIKESSWYQGLKDNEKKKVSMKLYELIPRKCSVDITGSDKNIKKVDAKITINADRTGNNREIKLQMYSITEGSEVYYFLCDCPYVLKTISNVNDIQMTGIPCSKYSVLPWKKNPTMQLFTVDTKLVQLMRFYYAISSLLCLKTKDTNLRDNARLLLFNESEEKLSDVLLPVIREDVGEKTSKQTTQKLLTLFKDIWYGINYQKLECKEEKISGSLMESKLLSTEERKDIFYDFDAFITHPQWLNRNAELNALERETSISKALKAKSMKILDEKDCLGKDWLEKITFAATKCRWILFLEEQNCKNKQFTSSEVVNSLKRVLEAKKVQTVAIVNERNELHVDDNLRWVTCIQDHSNISYKTETLYKIICGSELKLNKSDDLYLKPGEAAVGLAWGYVVSYLNKALPEMQDKVEQVMKDHATKYNLKNTLFILVPKSGKTTDKLDLECKGSTQPSSDSSRSYDFNVYKIHSDEEIFMPCQYAAPVEVLYKMREENLLNETQMIIEVKKFYTTVEKIMKIVLPGKTNVCEFIYYDDTKMTVSEVLEERLEKEKLSCDKQLPW